MPRLDYRLTIRRDGEITGELAIDGHRSTSRGGQLDIAGARGLLADEAAALNQDDALSRARLQDIGTALYRLAFPYPVACHFEERAWRRIEERPAEQTHLALALWLHQELPGQVLALPWELLYLPCGETFLGTDPRVALARSYADWISREWPPISSAEALRILLIHCQPRDTDLGPIAILPLLNRLQELAEATGHLARPEVTIACRPGDIERALKVHRPHIAHLLAHGRYSNDRTEFALTDPDTGQVRWYSDLSLADIVRPYPPRLFFLHSCEGARGSPERPFANGAAWLVRAHVPAVLAMQFPVTNAMAWRFANEFYGFIADGDDLDRAVQSARRVLAHGGPNTAEGHGHRDIATPTLWMQPAARRFYSKPQAHEPETESAMETDNIRVLVETPDHDALETVVSGDTLVNEILEAVLDQWEPPPDLASHPQRYQLYRASGDDPPLARSAVLDALVTQKGELRLRLVPEPLNGTSPVGLVVEDAAGDQYRTQVRLDTMLDDLAGEFLAQLGTATTARQVTCEQVGPLGLGRRRLEPNQTLYEAGVGDDARLRIVTSAQTGQGAAR